MRSLVWVVAAAALLPAACRRADVDAQLAAEIDRIKAIDNHAHPMRALNEGEKDSEFDALPVEMMERYETAPLRVRPENPEYRTYSESLFAGDKRRAMRDKGDAYPAWVLDQLGIEVMLANRVGMGRGLPPERFKWVPYADALMYPFNNQRLSQRDPDRKAFFTAEENLLRRYLNEAGTSGIPKTLDDYLRFVSSTLNRWKAAGAVAVKLEMAYLRTLEVGNPDRATVDRVYTTYSRGGVPPDAEYRSLQDFVFRHIAAECGRLGMPLHFHSSAGAGRYFDLSGINPVLLVPVIVDGAMRKTNFVFVHGAWPYSEQLTALLDKPNVYADFSEQSSLLYPRALAQVLRSWLEYVPEKVLFGTDASPLNDRIGWEETGRLAERTGRQALALALSGMLRDGEITRDRANQLAHMVMRDNARRLYGW